MQVIFADTLIETTQAGLAKLQDLSNSEEGKLLFDILVEQANIQIEALRAAIQEGKHAEATRHEMRAKAFEDVAEFIFTHIPTAAEENKKKL